MVNNCCECGKTFSTLYNLRKHARKYHPDKVNDVAPKKKFTYQCDPCKRKFNLLRDFEYHNKKHLHSREKNSLKKTTANLKCGLCEVIATKAKLLIHFETEHDVQIKRDIFEFNSAEEFDDWKNKLENSTGAQFVKETGNFYMNNSSIIKYYVCHRSGNYIPKGKGLRHLKKQGSNKINGFCPASIKVKIEKNKYRVNLINQHVGHQNDLGHLSLTLEERTKLAKQMTLKIPFTEILDQVRDSIQGSQLERIHLLTRRDLLNIEKSFNLQSTMKRQQNDAISVDTWVTEMENNGWTWNPTSKQNDGILIGPEGCRSKMPEKETTDELKLTKEKEKIITNLIPNLIQIVENMSCMEQVVAFRKLCTPIESTILAIAIKHEAIEKPAHSA